MLQDNSESLYIVTYKGCQKNDLLWKMWSEVNTQESLHLQHCRGLSTNQGTGHVLIEESFL